jgi:hypothetical protein
MPTLPTQPTLEAVLQGLHESEIRCGIQNGPPAGGITAWIDYGSRTEKATFYGTIVGDKEVWPAADSIAAWMHKTTLRLFRIVPMPRPMPAKRTTLVEMRARALCAKLTRVSDDTPMEYREVRLNEPPHSADPRLRYNPHQN